MDNKQLFGLCLAVISDWRTIFITVLTFFFIGIANYTVNYRKKPRIKKKAAKPAPAPAPAPAEEEKKEE